LPPRELSENGEKETTGYEPFGWSMVALVAGEEGMKGRQTESRTDPCREARQQGSTDTLQS